MTPERFQQIEELYHAARNNRGVLDTADPALRSEVESLLAQNPSGEVIDHPAWEAAPSLIEPRPAGQSCGDDQELQRKIEALLAESVSQSKTPALTTAASSIISLGKHSGSSR